MAFLYLIMITSGTSTDVVRRFQFDSYSACATSLAKMKVENRKETTLAAFCANEKNQRHYNATWWNDETK
jgi:hypothetical protein